MRYSTFPERFMPNRKSNPHYHSIFTDHGPNSILHAVQMHRVFPDSKTFVDMKVLRRPEEVQAAFDALAKRHAPLPPPKKDVAEFVRQHFTMENQMEDHVPQVISEKIKFASAMVHYTHYIFV